jgi:hypothetical protein
MIEVGSNLEISSEKYAGQVFPAALFLLFPEILSYAAEVSACWFLLSENHDFVTLPFPQPPSPPPPNVSQTEQTVGWDFYVALVYVFVSRKL